MDRDGGVLKINIYGTEYPIKSDPNTDAEYIARVAEYVDGKMREIDQNAQSRSALKVAILAALNITDELFQERFKDRSTDSTDSAGVGSRIKEMSEALDKALGDPSR